MIVAIEGEPSDSEYLRQLQQQTKRWINEIQAARSNELPEEMIATIERALGS